ncbi:MAG TPA: hypothetical protein PLA50_07370, partial [Bacteroidia bacterium]|nr:hypothetical protein [Bacteroidia bacterium]
LTGLVQSIGYFLSPGVSASDYLTFVSAMFPLVVGIVLWFLARSLSRLLAGREEESVRLEGVTEEQLHSTAFLGVGLLFALSSFASVFNWIHHFAVIGSFPSSVTEGDFYRFTEDVLTFVVGLFLVFTCRTWAAKLARRRRPQEEPCR